MTTFEQHLDVLGNALKHEWAREHVAELGRIHRETVEQPELVSERELRLAAQHREQETRAALAAAEAELAAERAAHTEIAAAYTATKASHDQLAADFTRLSDERAILAAKAARLEDHLDTAMHGHGGPSLIWATIKISELEQTIRVLQAGGVNGAEIPV